MENNPKHLDASMILGILYKYSEVGEHGNLNASFQ